MSSWRPDVELARRCERGDEDAWERFVREYRPVLYRAADALDPSRGARELADALYGELFGVEERDGERRSLFRYYQGKSSLATWLRAVLAQRYVDRQRVQRRLEPLPDVEPVDTAARDVEPERSQLLPLVTQALTLAIARLADRDRLRLAFYYVQELTLAEIGRALGEHEATASRQLAKSRKTIRTDVERRLKDEYSLGAAEIERALQLAAEDPGPLDLRETFDTAERKKSPLDRSI